MTRTLLLDSDIYAYEDASKGEVRADWDGDGNVDQLPESIEEIQSRLDNAIANVTAKLKADAVIVCLSCERQDNFRKDFYPLYKETGRGPSSPCNWSRRRSTSLGSTSPTSAPGLRPTT